MTTGSHRLDGGQLLAAVCDSMVTIFRDFSGKGPHHCKSHWAGSDILVVLLRGGYFSSPASRHDRGPMPSAKSGPGTAIDASSASVPRGTPPDAQLVDLMQGRDTRAFELVYERHAAAALGLARRIVGDRGLAEEVTQEAFVSVWRSAANYRPARGSVRTWVLGITRNRAIDALRRRSSQDRVRSAAEAFTDRSTDREPTNDAAVRNAEARAVRGAVGELPEEQRRTVELAFFGGLTQVEIASELDLPLGTVKGRMRLALDKLRRVLGPSEGVT